MQPRDPWEASKEHSYDFWPRQVSYIVEYHMEDDTVLYDPEAKVMHVLNPSAGVVWKLCDGQREAEEIVAESAQMFGTDTEVGEDDVREILVQFREVGLLRIGLGDSKSEI